MSVASHLPLQANPFDKKVNMFDLAALIAESRARVDFDALVPKVWQPLPSQ